MSILQRFKDVGKWLAAQDERPELDLQARWAEAGQHLHSPALSAQDEIEDEDDILELSPLYRDGREARTRIARAFSTALPVEDRFGLSGRRQEMQRLADAMLDQRKHGLIFGARGSGKTSLSRVFGDYADEVGCYVIYNSASGDITFADLFRACIDYLPGIERKAAQRALEVLNTGGFEVRDLVSLFLEVPRQTVIVLDEFDRIENSQTKEDIAGLMKLLTDMHAPVQLLVVGIAGNMDDLLIAHPSLRRHLVALQVKPMEVPNLLDLVRNCGKDAGIRVEEDAARAIAIAAMGSPYHARLFGMNAAFAALSRYSEEVVMADLSGGFAAAVAEWREMSGPTFDLAERVAADSSGMLAVIAITAAYSPLFTQDMVAANAKKHLGEGSDWTALAGRTIERLMPVLQESQTPGAYLFQDTLAPQFLLLIVEQMGKPAAPSATEDSIGLNADVHNLFAGLKQS